MADGNRAVAVADDTLWDRVERVLQNNAVVVVILGVVVLASGVKTVIEGYEAVRSLYVAHVSEGVEATSIVPCHSIARLASIPAVVGEETPVSFVNDSPRAATVSWIDENKVRRSYLNLPAGTQDKEITYPGHVWLVSDSAGGCIGLVVKGTAPSIVERTADDHLHVRPPRTSTSGAGPDKD